MEDDYKKKIQNNYELLKDSLEPLPLADFLFDKSRITTEQHESINVTHVNWGKTAASRKCLEILRTSGPDTFECLKEFLKSDTARHFILEKLEQEIVEDIRVVMFGKTGVGKSLLGNNILGQNIFSSRVYARSVNTKPTRGERLIGNNCKLSLTDTPGLFDTSTNDNLKTAKILASTVKKTKPGPHIFIFVLSIGRFTAEERATVEFLKDLFGVHVTDYLIIVFTRKGDLDYNKIDLKTYLDEADDDLKSIVKQCKGVMTINNHASDSEIKESVDSLVKMIKDVYIKNNKQHYTDESLAEAQKMFDEKLRLQEEKAHKRERDLEAEMEKIVKENDLQNNQLHENIRKEKRKNQVLREQEEEAHRRERELDARNKKLDEEKDMIRQQYTKLEENLNKQQSENIELQEYYLKKEKENDQKAKREQEETNRIEQEQKDEMMKLREKLEEYKQKELLFEVKKDSNESQRLTYLDMMEDINSKIEALISERLDLTNNLEIKKQTSSNASLQASEVEELQNEIENNEYQIKTSKEKEEELRIVKNFLRAEIGREEKKKCIVM